MAMLTTGAKWVLDSVRDVPECSEREALQLCSRMYRKHFNTTTLGLRGNISFDNEKYFLKTIRQDWHHLGKTQRVPAEDSVKEEAVETCLKPEAMKRYNAQHTKVQNAWVRTYSGTVYHPPQEIENTVDESEMDGVTQVTPEQTIKEIETWTPIRKSDLFQVVVLLQPDFLPWSTPNPTLGSHLGGFFLLEAGITKGFWETYGLDSGVMFRGIQKTIGRVRSTKPDATPFHSLPDDIIEEIFHSLVKMPSTKPLALTLSHVSRRWRAVSVSSPRLWCDLGDILVDVSITATREAHLLERLAHQIHLSKDKPISFKFDAGMPILTRLFPVAGSILSFLARQCRRWGNVELCIHIGIYPHIQHISMGLINLRHLSLKISGDVDGPFLLDCFMQAPQLRSVSLELPKGPELFNSRTAVSLPWNQLTHYADSATRDLSLSDLQSLGVVSKDRLSTLSIEFLVVGTSPLLRHLSLPALTHLSVVAVDMSTIFDDIQVLLTSSRCSLQSLEFTGSAEDWGEKSPLRVLQACPDLISLSINHVPPDLCHWFSSTSSGTHPLFLPNLTSLTLLLTDLYLSPTPDYAAFGDLARCMDNKYQSGIAPKLGVAVQTRQSTRWRSWAILSELEGFPRLPHDDFCKLERWQVALREQSKAVASSRWEPFKPSYYGRMHELRSALEEMERCSLDGYTVASLLSMNIPALLNKATTGKANYIPRDDIFGLSRRAKKLIDAWKPVLVRDAAIYRHWRCRGEDRLIYLHTESGGNQAVLPFLQDLKVVNAPHDFNYHAALDIVGARQEGGILKRPHIALRPNHSEANERYYGLEQAKIPSLKLLEEINLPKSPSERLSGNSNDPCVSVNRSFTIPIDILVCNTAIQRESSVSLN
ncbi:hypothetical protein NMY22_g1368 [Coprinellus aureogranulatus]|nr:hypothetical protein NMY22_g1368 [Coprinellus aureogranulatus]